MPKNATRYCINFHHNYYLPTRQELHEGQQHLVVPVVMMVEGVHCGSGGPMLYLPEEYAVDPQLWNGVPVPVLHPTENGAPISCNSPQTIERYNVGRIYNAHIDQGKLKAEAWINIAKANAVWPELIPMIQAGQPIDVSTGLYSYDEMVPGIWNEEVYNGIVRSIRPDHLAILPNQQGSCSWQDGCGIRLNNEGGEGMAKEKVGSAEEAQALSKKISENVSNPEKRSWVKRGLASLARHMGLTVVDNAVSDEEIRMQLQRKVDELDRPSEPQPGLYHCVVAVYSDENYFVYEARSNGEVKLYKQQFKIEDEKAVPDGAATEVREERTFVAAANDNKESDQQQVGPLVNKEVKKMSEKQKKVDALIANEKSGFTEDQRQWLMGLDDVSFDNVIKVHEMTTASYEETINKLTANTNRESASANESEASKEKSTAVTSDPDQFIANAPAEIADMLKEGLSMRNQKKAGLVQALTANAACPFTKEELEQESIPKLERLVQLAGMAVPKPDYTGRAGSTTANTAAPKANERQDNGTGVPDMPKLSDK